MSVFFLIGFMGSGKTSLGKIAAGQIGFDFLDMDSAIEKNEGLSISDIFQKYGEVHFRELEYKVLRDISPIKNTVIATGGGVPVYKDNMEYMNTVGETIYINLSPEQLKSRLEATDIQSRPLLKGKNNEEILSFITHKLKEREKYYLRAHHIIEDEDDEKIIRQIIKIIST